MTSQRHILLTLFALTCGIFVLAPIVVIVINSFNSESYNVFPPESLSLRWYRHLAEQEQFLTGALRSIRLALLSTVLSLLTGIAAAYALLRHPFPGAGLIRSLLLTPIVLPKIVLGIACYMFFARLGAVDSFWNLLLVHVLVSFPFVLVVVGSALANMDWSLEEAARDLGSARIRSFFLVILPQISTSVWISAIFAFMTSFDQVETTLFLMRPGENTLPIEMFLYLERAQDPTIAALSVLVIGLSAIVTLIAWLILRRRRDAASPLGGGPPEAPPPGH